METFMWFLLMLTFLGAVVISVPANSVFLLAAGALGLLVSVFGHIHATKRSAK